MALKRVLWAGVTIAGTAGAALAEPQKSGQDYAHNWQMGLQPAASPVMERLHSFHFELLVLITAICIFVAGLLIFVLVRFNQRRNPVPERTEHNTALEIAWTVVPVLILAVIAWPSFKLLYYEAEIPKPDVTIEAIGRQWYWTYVYPNEGKFQFDSNMLADNVAKERGEPRLLGVDNPVYVPVNKVVEIITTGGDVIHSWAVPAFGVKMDAIPGRLNHTWFKATKIGTYYGQCSELCGANHAFMPIEVKVVSEAEYRAWLTEARNKFASGGSTELALNKSE
ncbi:cytochrome c oxidase subunit 2 [Rhizomicrobium palustre]|uniref:Cytochrome c oxidase subunit 2 n=1 Tax=Rhizomicrobium palustre TaxID=189966 RepID=A0A846N1I5_9PROT|nr:cytochrome c oxidase subunit II [Rhizomicrobium palustre]NIK89349.1 cytochrome c oxidase subunit 2 [Rhizomicrobium palustre]